MTLVNLIYFYISPLKSLNLVLIHGAKLDRHRGTWTGCKINKIKILTYITSVKTSFNV